MSTATNIVFIISLFYKSLQIKQEKALGAVTQVI